MVRVIIAGVVVGLAAAGGCRGGSGGDEAGGEEGGPGGEEEGSPEGGEEWSANCPDTAFSMMTCVGSTEGARCPGRVYCDCGERVTPCVCVPYEAGFHFECEDDCEAACDPPAEEEGDGGAEEEPPAGPTSCEAFCAPQLASSCPAPPTGCMSDCETLEAAMPPECRETWEQVKACTAAAEMACDSSGVPFPVGCDEPSEALLGCLGM